MTISEATAILVTLAVWWVNILEILWSKTNICDFNFSPEITIVNTPRQERLVMIDEVLLDITIFLREVYTNLKSLLRELEKLF